MILSDKSIRDAIEQGHIVIKPFREEDLQPASYDVHLGVVKVPLWPLPPKDIRDHMYMAEAYSLMPGDFVLAGLQEYTAIDNTLAARIEGISTLGRQGISIHVTSGYVDPGWSGILTVEIANISKQSFLLTTGMRIAQLSFMQLDQPSEKAYSGRYQGATGPEEAK